MSRLQNVVAAARAAVLERSGALAVERQRVSGTSDSRINTQYDPQSDYQGDLGKKLGPMPANGGRMTDIPARRINKPRPVVGAWRFPRHAQELPVPRILATFQNAEVVAQGAKLSRGATRLWITLHRLAVDVARQREYNVTPEQVTFHVPAVSLAGLLEYHADHVARLGRELERAGLLDFGGHAQTVLGRSMWDGCLWAVKTRREAEPPRIRGDEWRAVWRPDFAADVEGRTGAAVEMSGLQARQADTEERYLAVKHRAAALFGHRPPAMSSPDNFNPAGLRAVSDALGGIWSVHARYRGRRIGQLASAMCAALGEPERRRYWCRVIWAAFQASGEGRSGLQGLAAQVARLAADIREGAPWRSPGAVLASRLKAAC